MTHPLNSLIYSRLYSTLTPALRSTFRHICLVWSCPFCPKVVSLSHSVNFVSLPFFPVRSWLPLWWPGITWGALWWAWSLEHFHSGLLFPRKLPCSDLEPQASTGCQTGGVFTNNNDFVRCYSWSTVPATRLLSWKLVYSPVRTAGLSP